MSKIDKYKDVDFDKKEIDILIMYETANSFWTDKIWFEWGQNMIAKIIQNRVLRKYKKYKTFKNYYDGT